MQDLPTLLEIALIIALVVIAVSRLRKRLRKRPRRHRYRSKPALKVVGMLGKPHGDFTAKVARVIDGDTVDVITDGRKFRIRLDSIDCPEDGQHWGDTAKYGLIKLIGGKAVFLENHGVDHYERILATIYVSQDRGPDRINVNERMVALGHAWVMRQFYSHLPMQRRDSLNRIENWARTRKVGLWRSPNPIPPWEWRASDGSR